MALLSDKVAIVTGSTKGIGLSIARIFSKNGANVVVTSRSLDMAKNIVDDLSSYGNDSMALKTDVSKTDSVINLAETVIEHYDRIDILINNAGYPLNNEYWDSSFDKLKIDDYQRVLDVDLLGSIRCCMQIIPIMKKQKNGNIINISSTPAIAGYDKGIPYTIAKSGLLALTKHLALEYGKFNIRVNSLALGNIRTSSTFDQIDKIEQEKLGTESSLRRWGEPDEVAKTCLMLVSDNFSFVTGQTIIVDGGTVMF